MQALLPSSPHHFLQAWVILTYTHLKLNRSVAVENTKKAHLTKSADADRYPTDMLHLFCCKISRGHLKLEMHKQAVSPEPTPV